MLTKHYSLRILGLVRSFNSSGLAGDIVVVTEILGTFLQLVPGLVGDVIDPLLLPLPVTEKVILNRSKISNNSHTCRTTMTKLILLFCIS